jgi:hypothetical protein
MDIPALNDETKKQENLYNLTKERIKRLTMEDLKEILQSMDESDARVMVNAIKAGRYDNAAHMLEFLTFTTMQKKIEK